MIQKLETKTEIDIIKEVDLSDNLQINEAYIIAVVNGKDKLRTEHYYNEYNQNQIFYFLDDVLLLKSYMSEDPVSAGKLATGYGIENVNLREMDVLERITNQDFYNLKEAIENLSPFLKLLTSGLYIITDTYVYPTNGKDRFFWNVRNKLTDQKATGTVSFDDIEYVRGRGKYIYPSKSSYELDMNRVNYYIERRKKTPLNRFPRALGYHVEEYMNLLLDGHHKATAAMKLGDVVPCINIVPITRNKFNSLDRENIYFQNIRVNVMEIPEEYRRFYDYKYRGIYDYKFNKAKEYIMPENLINKPWPKSYDFKAKHYPGIENIAKGVIYNIYDWIEDGSIFNIKTNANMGDLDIYRLELSIRYLVGNKDERGKELAIRWGKVLRPRYRNVRKQCFKSLSTLSKDKDVEKFFIDYLVEDEDLDKDLKKIADHYLANIK